MIHSYRQSAPRLEVAPGASTRLDGQPFFTRWRLAFLGVVLLSILTYLPSLHGLKVWDDIALLDGSGIGGGDSFWDALTKPFLNAYFRPLVSASFYVENRLWHGNPFLYHQTNILLHVATVAALMGLLLKAFGSRRVALLGGLLFAVQPAQVSTVAWIGGRTDSLCALLVTLFAYTLVLAIKAEGTKRKVWCGLSVLAFFLAAVTKEQVVALLPLVPLGVYAFGANRGADAKRAALRWLAPFLAATVVFAVLWGLNYPNPFPPLRRGPVDQLATAGQAGVYYLLLLLAPSAKWMHTLSLGSLQAAGLGVAILGLLVWLGFGVFSLKSARNDPRLGFFALLGFLALLPISNLVPLPSLLVAPYRAGVAGVGIAASLAILIGLAKPSISRYLMPAAALWAGWCCWLTGWGAGQWKDPITIFTQISRQDPYSIITRRNLSLDLLRQGRTEDAAQHMQTILTMLYGSDAWKSPETAYARYRNDAVLRRRVQENQGNEVKPEAWLGELFSQLGYAEAKLKQFPESRSSFRTALLIEPRSARARTALAQYAIFDGDLELAIRHLRVAIAVHPGDPSLYALIAHIYGETGRMDLAEANYTQSIKMQPWFGPTYVNYADLQAKKGDFEGALKTLQEAKRAMVQETKGIDERIERLESGLKNRNVKARSLSGRIMNLSESARVLRAGVGEANG